jgi:hypothetical protein
VPRCQHLEVVVHIVVVDVTSFSPCTHSHVGVGFRVYSRPSMVKQTSLIMNVRDMLANDLLDGDGCENVIGISIVGILIHMFTLASWNRHQGSVCNVLMLEYP